MVKFSKSAQKTLRKLYETVDINLSYDDVKNLVDISTGCDWLYETKLNKKDCLNLAEIFLKLAKTIDKNAPKAGKIKVVEVEKEVEVKVEDKLQGVYVARLLGYTEEVLDKGGVIGTYVTKEDLIDSLNHNGYLYDEESKEYIKTFDDGRKYTALIEYLLVNRKNK